ncbi:bile acid:sodium symporter family protein [Sphingobium sp. CR2-8]|uniref:bile acid:sodium symporter family protein n=1 Tax=Sphingobium sp. CR2-8 TaxID=1306534 RepID=UPI002DBB235D|nr:bile acid:sodium symporter family protein [Sphingobium sp. CR2-8]MEC3909769.1 bile acid:sodium symporter family protein [Sphingobium sp. CR2-8]
MVRVSKPSFLPDPFLICLIATVVGASFIPVRGAAIPWVEATTDFAIALLFFLHGAKLSREAVLAGAGNWRLHLYVLSSTYILFPLIGLTLVALLHGHGNDLLLKGLVYLSLLPSTVQSSIAFTAIAGGNVAAAVCSASLSNIVGIILTPLLVGLFMAVDGGGSAFSWHSVQAIALQLLVPFLAGHLMRPWIGAFIDRNKRLLMPVDRGSILLVVYTAFSAAVVSGIWTEVGIFDLLMLLLLSLVMLIVVMGANLGLARLVGLPRADMIVLLFCGSKKSLVSGVPMAGALFPAAQVGIIILPLMIFHQVQLFLCAALASRFARAGRARPLIPRTVAEIESASQRLGLTIAEPCMAGVTANLALLDRHADTLFKTETP